MPTQGTAVSDHVQSQHMRALHRANEVRLQQAQFKQEVKKRGASILVDELLDVSDYLENAKVFDLIRAIPKYGKVRAEGLLRQCGISSRKALGELTPRQRQELILHLRTA